MIPETCPLYIAGEWRQPAGLDTAPVHNPSRGEVIAAVPLCGVAEVDAAVRAAAAALPDWANTPPGARAQVLFRLKALLEEDFDALCLGIAQEHGKTLGETSGDLRRGIEMVEFSCGAPALLTGENLGKITWRS